jgi:hypothetical protein
MSGKPEHTGGAVSKAQSPTELLADILDVLRADRVTDMPADAMDVRDIPLPAAAGSLELDTDVQYGYVYIPDSPRDLAIYLGHRGEFFGTFSAGADINFKLPRQTGMTLVYGAGAAVSTLTIYLSARPIEVNTTSSATAPGGVFTPSDAQANPSNVAGVEAFGMVWDNTNSVWRRMRSAIGVGWPAVAIASATAVGDAGTGLQSQSVSGGNGLIAVTNSIYNGATWDRLRTPTTFKSVLATANGATALWTPGAGKKFRLMRFKLQVPANTTTAGGALITVGLLDAAANIGLDQSVFVPAAATALTELLETGWIDLGNGYLSTAANNVLNINLSAALTAGGARIIACGTEE